MITIPPAFAAGVMALRGDEGARWLQSLPEKIKSYCDRWSLEIEDETWHGYLALVVAVRRGSERCALKVGWVEEETRDEALALRLWNGNGAVRLLNADEEEGVLLLERLDSSSSLVAVEIEEAVKIAGCLLRRLAIPAPDGVPQLQDYAQRQAATMHELWKKLEHPIPEEFVVAAQSTARRLGPCAKKLLVNQDLHYENVLAGKREPWLVIDPKVISGDIEFGVAPLLWNRFDQANANEDIARKLDLLIRHAELDRELALGWTLVRCVDYCLWAHEAGLTEDPANCETITEWILRHQ